MMEFRWTYEAKRNLISAMYLSRKMTDLLFYDTVVIIYVYLKRESRAAIQLLWKLE